MNSGELKWRQGIDSKLHTRDAIDDFVRHSGRFMPRWGWHDDHREKDRTDEYLPAMQQVREECLGLIDVISERSLNGTALQLGLGACQCSHEVWRLMFRTAITIDLHQCLVDDTVMPGLDTHSPEAIQIAGSLGPYDFLFIDAGHKLEDVRRDYNDYGPMVRPGGIIAFHDAAKRPGYEEEVDVWRFLLDFRGKVHMLGSEVGTAWTIREGGLE